MLHAQIDGRVDRLEHLPDRETGFVQRPKPCIVKVLFEARHAAIVDIGIAENVRGSRAGRIEAFAFLAEIDARKTERQNVGLLARRDLALDPAETRTAGQVPHGAFVIEVRQHAVQGIERLVGALDPLGLGEKRFHANIESKHFSVPVQNAWPGGSQLHVGGGVRARTVGRHGAEPYEPSLNDGEGRHDGADDQGQPLPCTVHRQPCIRHRRFQRRVGGHQTLEGCKSGHCRRSERLRRSAILPVANPRSTSPFASTSSTSGTGRLGGRSSSVASWFVSSSSSAS